ncbi:MAG: hypothetical protein AAF497_20645, partial [Planctomycetota bacterium]
RTNDVGKVLTSEDFAFRPVYIANAPDGSVLLADFYEHYITHGQHYQSQIDPKSGRIFRLRGKDVQRAPNIYVLDETTDELISLLSHANRWHRHTAVRLLGERKEESATPKLKKLIRNASDLEALCALWALHQAENLDDDSVLVALQHEYPPVRYWAVRLLCDDLGFAHKRSALGLLERLGESPDGRTRISEHLMDALVQQAQRESNVEVRSQMAASARRLSVDQALALLKELLQHQEDVDDPYAPLMCWWVIEANLDRGREEVLGLLSDDTLRREPMVVKHILGRVGRALALKGKNRDLLACGKLFDMVDSQEQADEVLKGFELAFAGRQAVGLPKALARALMESGRTSLNLRIRLGDRNAIGDGIKLLGDKEADVNLRVGMARALSEVRCEGAVPSLLELAASSKDAKLQRIAMTSVSVFDDPQIAVRLLRGAVNYPVAVRPAFFDVMLSRTSWSKQLMEAISSSQLESNMVPPDVIDQLRQHTDSAIASATVGVFGAGTNLGPLRIKKRIDELRVLLGEGTGNPYAGEELFMQKCVACHKLFHKGGNVGPDLTPNQRGNLDTLLMSVVDPSAEIREGFEQTILVTNDGRILTGFVIDEDTQIVTIRSKSGENVRVARDDIDSRNTMKKSIMPDGLLQDLTDQQLRDLFAYLRISQPISH